MCDIKTQARKEETNGRLEVLPLRGETPPSPRAFREGGEDGVVEGLAPKERRLPPPEGLGRGVKGLEYFHVKT